MDAIATFALALSLMKGAPEARIAQVASKSVQVAAKSKPLWACDKSGERTARFLTVFAAKESAGIETAIGDSGEAWGWTQIHWRIWGDFLIEQGVIATEFDLFDGETSMVSTLAIMHHLISVCGNVERAAYAYASGSCFGSMQSIPKVKSRLTWVGGC